MVFLHTENLKIAKSLIPSWPAWTVQADMGGSFLEMH